MMYYLMHVKKAFQSFMKGGVYWVNETNALKVPLEYATFYPSELIPKYDGHRVMLLVRSAGIGDIIALSSLTDIADKTVILTQAKYRPLEKYFANDVEFRSFEQPLFFIEYPYTLDKYIRGWGMMYGDTEIDNGSTENWYKIFSRSVEVEFEPEFGRPLLKSQTTEIDNVCIIVSQSSNINRTADKKILEQVAKVHFDNVIHADEMGWSFAEYLQALDRAKFVISVDTSAIHFREGIGKPALGIYGAFSTESRTKYYKFTKSIDIKSKCKIQPCFKHDGQVCPHVTNKSRFAPCLSEQLTQDIIEQIHTALYE